MSWDGEPSGVDAGMPRAVRDVFSKALASVTRVTFPISVLPAAATARWVPFGPDMALRLARSRWLDRAMARLGARPEQITLASTLRAESIDRLFRDQGFPWWLQAQVALLSPPSAPLPDLDFGVITDLLDGERHRTAKRLLEQGVQALLCPAVDGDAAGLLGLAGDLDERIVDAIETQTATR